LNHGLLDVVLDSLCVFLADSRTTFAILAILAILVAVFALAAPWGWIGLLAPAAILHLLLNVTGVPMAEASSLQSKGDAYRAYQQRVSRFFPRPPRHP
jgi:steroid 5-alpha reductase family enzyme